MVMQIARFCDISVEEQKSKAEPSPEADKVKASESPSSQMNFSALNQELNHQIHIIDNVSSSNRKLKS